MEKIFWVNPVSAKRSRSKIKRLKSVKVRVTGAL
jgi:hypothetical protein